MEISLLVLFTLYVATTGFIINHLFGRIENLEAAMEELEFDSCKAVV